MNPVNDIFRKIDYDIYEIIFDSMGQINLYSTEDMCNAITWRIGHDEYNLYSNSVIHQIKGKLGILGFGG